MKVMTFNLRYDDEIDGDHRWSLRQDTLLQSIRKHKQLLLGPQKLPKIFYAFGNPKGIEVIDFIYTATLTFVKVNSDSSQFDFIYPSDHTPVIAELT